MLFSSSAIVSGLNYECEIERQVLLCTRQRHTPEYIVIEFPDYDDWPQELLVATVLFESDILSQVAVPHFAFVKEKSRLIGVMEHLLERHPCLIIFLLFAFLFLHTL